MSNFNRNQIKTEMTSLAAMGMSQAQIAEKLNEKGLKTSTGLEWNDVRVGNFKNLTGMTRKLGKKVAKAKKAKPAAPRAKAAKDAGDELIDWLIPMLRRKDWDTEKNVRVLTACLEA